jgi:hypothetical protein
MRYIYTMEYYSTIKKNEIMLFAGKWLKLQVIMLGETSPVQGDRNHMGSHICGI